MSTARTILLTGASGKLGQVLCRALMAEGHTVVGTTRHQQSAHDLEAAMADERGGRIVALPVDFTEVGGVEELISVLKARGLAPDGVVHNARSQAALAIGDDGVTKREPFLAEFTVDVVAPYELTMALTRSQALRDVVVISSIYGVVAANTALYDDPKAQSPVQYSVAKAAQIQLARELAVRLASDNVRVNSIAFGGVEGRVTDAFKARYAGLCPQGSMLTESDVVGPVLFLLSGAASAMTGHTLVVDGGWTAW